MKPRPWRRGIFSLPILVGVAAVFSPGERSLADCTLTNLGFKPLCDLGWGSYTQNFTGGLYPGGANSRPPTHEAAGLRIAAEQIQPLDPDGMPDATNGQIVVLSSGM